MSRTHDLVFRMINEGMFTPESALEEARVLHDHHNRELLQDTIDLLVHWAWEKQDEIEREARAAHEALVKVGEHEVKVAGWMLYHVRRARETREFNGRVTGNGEEPF